MRAEFNWRHLGLLLETSVDRADREVKVFAGITWLRGLEKVDPAKVKKSPFLMLRPFNYYPFAIRIAAI
jgi:hypothetical protein